MTEKPEMPAPPCSIQAFARWVGVDPKSVRLAIKTGRLTAAVLGEDAEGRRMILDPEAAAAEWAAHSRPRVDSRKPPEGDAEPSALAQATLRERTARAEAFELETARKKGLLVSAASMDLRWASIAGQIRTGLLGLPTRARQRLPHLTSSDILVLDLLVREVLDELAAAGERDAAAR